VISITQTVPRLSWCDGRTASDTDTVVSEVPVALVYNGISHVVMMATPADLEDLARGFSLTESIIASPRELLDCELQQGEKGLELQMRISGERFALLKQRRRNLVGRTGCGLCGVESLEQAMVKVARVNADYELPHTALQAALGDLKAMQQLKHHSGGVHGAAWCDRAGAIECLREDVGRHNALDKLLGALSIGEYSPQGFVLVTSRASYEMVAKVASCGIPVLAAVSAPTSLAIEQAAQCGLTLVAFVQPGRQVAYTHTQRLVGAS
jgi:FdhD protein